MIYLDNAATTSPKPQCVIDSVLCGMRLSANPGRSGHDMSLKASETVFETRKTLSDFFNLKKPENVVFTSNCTQSINTALKGLIEPQSHVICSDLEHNSVLRTLENLKNERGISYDTAKTYPSEEDTVNSFECLIKKDTAAIVCTHASNVFGDILPVEKIGKLCRKYNLVFIVDAAQSAGTVSIDIEKMNIDALCIPGHKGLYGSMGSGALLLKNDNIMPFIFGGTGSESANINQPDYLPDRLESGTLNLPGIMSMRAGADFVKRIGLKSAHSYETELCREIYNFLSDDKRYRVYSCPPSENTVPVVSFCHMKMKSEETADILNQCGICTRAGYHCAYLAHMSRQSPDGGLVRISTGVFNSKKDVKNLINSLYKIENERIL